LDGAWPSGDVARVKTAIMAARARGIEGQVARVTSATMLPPKWVEKPFVYEYLKPVGVERESSAGMAYGVPGVGERGPVPVAEQRARVELYEADREPQPILLWRPPPSAPMQGEETVELTIDEAGKVESVKMVAPGSDPDLLRVAKEWRFIPALRDGRPVAYKLKMDVRPLR
jgi:TonB family protein